MEYGIHKANPGDNSHQGAYCHNGAIAFQELRIMEIAGPMGNAARADVLDGKTFSNDAGTGFIGTMPNRGGMSYTPTTTDQTIVAGYYNGSGKVVGDSNLVPGNIRSGATIFGVDGDTNVVDTSSGDAAAGDILKDKKAWVGGAEVTGTAAAGVNVSGADGSKSFTIPDGLYWDSKTATANDSDLAAGNIKNAIDIFGVTGELHGGCTCTTGTLYEDRWCDNADGTVTDLTTCLVWLQNASWVHSAEPWIYCNNSVSSLSNGQGGLSDGSLRGEWRMPTRREFADLVNGTPSIRCIAGPFSIYGFVDIRSADYWTSTTGEIAGYEYAYTIHMFDGFVGNGHRTTNKFRWPVRTKRN